MGHTYIEWQVVGYNVCFGIIPVVAVVENAQSDQNLVVIVYTSIRVDGGV